MKLTCYEHHNHIYETRKVNENRCLYPNLFSLMFQRVREVIGVVEIIKQK